MATYDTLTVDGSIGDWLAADRLNNDFNAVAGLQAFGRKASTAYVVAFQSTGATTFGDGTTFWLNTDLARATGLQVFGFAAGAEYAVTLSGGAATLTRFLANGSADAAFTPVVLDVTRSADIKTIEFAINTSTLGLTSPLEIFGLVNNATPLPGDFSGVAYLLASGATAAVKGDVTIDGSLAEWSAAQRIDTGAATAGYEVYGKSAGDSFVFALKSAIALGPNTTFWIDQNPTGDASTGYRVFGASDGVEYALEVGANGLPGLYSVNASTGALTPVGNAGVQFGFNADHTQLEVSFLKSAIGAPQTIKTLIDVTHIPTPTSTTFLPGAYVPGAGFRVVDTASLPIRTDMTKKVAIVYSETSASQYFSTTAYSQLFMTAQSQAAAAGVSYDVITEADLKDLSKLINYDAIVFPSFANVKAADVSAITNNLSILEQNYRVGIVAAGNFMTNDESGAALAGNSYARMENLLGVTRSTGGVGPGVIRAGDVTSTSMMDGYTAGETIRTYDTVTQLPWQDFNPVVAGAVTTVTQTVGGVTYDAAIATNLSGARNVHFGSESVAADSNLLQHAIQYSVFGSELRVGLQTSRFKEIVASRTDMDQSSFPEDVSPLDNNDQPTPGIYDQMIPILQSWKAQFNFVGSYYVNIGDPNNTTGTVLPQSTNWAKSLQYYSAILALGNEIGSHSTTHLLGLPAPATENTNFLTTGTGPGTFDYEFRLSRDILNQWISTVLPGYQDVGVAVPGATETLATAQQIIQYYEYMSGGYSSVGAGYPGGFGYLTPALADKIYIAPNVKFDFTYIGFMNLTAAQAEAAWAAEVANITGHGDTPIIVWPWHDYGVTNWITPGENAAGNYTTQMFTNFIAAAYNADAEFVTLADLAARLESFEKSGVTYTQSGAVINATVTSTDAGKFALDLDGLGTQKIASVANWYAYDEDSVFTPRNGGNFAITLGATQTDVTRITKLPMRAELLSVSGDGANLNFSVIGEGQVQIDLAALAGRTVTVNGAEVASLAGDQLTLTLVKNFVSNGSFESITPALGNAATRNVNNNATGGWFNSGDNTIEFGRGVNGVAATNGVNYLMIDGTSGVDSISQTLSTTAGKTYALTFDLRGTTVGSSGVEVYWNNALLATLDPSTSAWTNYTYDVTANATSTRLEFRELAAQNTSQGAYLDNVKVALGGVQQYDVSVALLTTTGNTPPVITSNGGGVNAAISLAENTNAVTNVAATDANAGQTITYSIVGGADATKFAIDAATGALTFITAPNFEVRTDADLNNRYLVNVAATDNLGGVDSQALTVTVTNVAGTNWTGTAGNDVKDGTAENDTLSGAAGNDTLRGLGDNDRLNGQGGNDTIYGGDGGDNIFGNAAADSLFGEAGADTINGGAGRDVMDGGDGADSFVFGAASDTAATTANRDVINGFVAGADKINLSAIDANTTLAANQAFTLLATAGAAFTAAGQIHFFHTTIGGIEHTIVEGNVNANLSADFAIDLVGRINLSAADFIL